MAECPAVNLLYMVIAAKAHSDLQRKRNGHRQQRQFFFEFLIYPNVYVMFRSSLSQIRLLSVVRTSYSGG